MRVLVPRLLALICGAMLAIAGQAADLTVSAAASLGQALRELAPLFEAALPGVRVQLNFGASGALLQQMSKGAPVDVFVSADQATMDQAQSQGLVRAASRRDIVSNTLVVIVPAGIDNPPRNLTDLTGPTIRRVALGVAASVPAGHYAKSALQAAGVWSAIEPKAIGAQTVRQVLDYVARGEVDAGFIYATDARLVPQKVSVAFTVPTPTPVRYCAAPLVASPNGTAAQRFVEFLLAPPAQAVLAKFGFGPP